MFLLILIYRTIFVLDIKDTKSATLPERHQDKRLFVQEGKHPLDGVSAQSGVQRKRELQLSKEFPCSTFLHRASCFVMCSENMCGELLPHLVGSETFS